MKGATLFFHSNLRFLRERKKMTQEDLSAVLELSRNKLQALESGKTKNPSAEDLIGFSDYFGVSVDTLLRVDLMRLGELQLRELMAGNDAYRTGSPREDLCPYETETAPPKLRRCRQIITDVVRN